MVWHRLAGDPWHEQLGALGTMDGSIMAAGSRQAPGQKGVGTQ